MTLSEYIEELKVDLEAHKTLIDPVSVAKWVIWALKPFGMNISTLQEDVITVEGGVAKLPQSFCSLYLAYRCEPHGCHVSGENEEVVQSVTSWVERSERGFKWNSCDPCCKEEYEKIIVEKKKIKTCDVEYYYTKPVLLKLGKSMVRNACHKECRNRLVQDCPYEISINKNTLYANFERGKIYMQFYGLPIDENKELEIPTSHQGYLEQYVDAFIKRKFFEKEMANLNIPQAANLFQTYFQMESRLKGLATTDVKFGKLTPNSFDRLAKSNRMDMLRYSMGLM